MGSNNTEHDSRCGKWSETRKDKEIKDIDGSVIERRGSRCNAGQCNIALSQCIKGGVAKVALWSARQGRGHGLMTHRWSGITFRHRR
jgi:hypothetical protein